jgi:transposase InsO family protein
MFQPSCAAVGSPLALPGAVPPILVLPPLSLSMKGLGNGPCRMIYILMVYPAFGLRVNLRRHCGDHELCRVLPPPDGRALY